MNATLKTLAILTTAATFIALGAGFGFLALWLFA
jgi:hypothetical protein